MEEKKPRLALYIPRTRGIEQADGFGHCTLELKQLDADNHIVRPTEPWPYEDLVFTCQWNRERPADSTYGWDLVFADQYQITLADAERMVKTLRRVEQAKQKLPVQPQSYGQFVQLVSRALGIKDVIVASPNGNGKYEWDISTPSGEKLTYDVLNINEVQFRVENAILDARSKDK